MTSRKSIALRAAIAVLVVGLLAWLFISSIRSTNSQPYPVQASTLSGWKVMAGQGAEDGAVTLVPPGELPSQLFRQLFQRTMQSLVSPARPAVPLVMQQEYDDSLQGVHSIDNIITIARDAGIESARFEPVCMARRSESAGGRTLQVFFVVFDSPVFDQFRARLMPVQPEHGGTGAPFDPAALEPTLIVASTEKDFLRWWPIGFKQDEHCQAPLAVS